MCLLSLVVMVMWCGAGIRGFGTGESQRAVIEFGKPLTLITGQNGAGKTVSGLGSCCHGQLEGGGTSTKLTNGDVSCLCGWELSVPLARWGCHGASTLGRGRYSIREYCLGIGLSVSLHTMV